MRERDFARRFACFTFDDGYRDNRDFALPVMAEFGAPFTVYVASDFASGTGRLWWVALERLIARADVVEAPIDGETTTARLPRYEPPSARRLPAMHGWLRGMPSDIDVNRTVSDLCRRHGLDDSRHCRELCMSWTELKDVRRRSAGDHRRAHAEPLQSRQVHIRRGRARDRRQPRQHRGKARTGR